MESPKGIIISMIILLTCGSAFSQYRNLNVLADSVPNLKIIQIDLVEGATIVHCKLLDEKGVEYCLPHDLVLFDPISYSAFKIFEGLNMPNCDNSHLVLSDQDHHFSIAFEPLHEGVESIQLKNGTQFWKEVQIDWELSSGLLNMEGFHSMTPFRILETNYVDGKTIKLYRTPEIVVAAQVEAVKEYGKYYRVNLTVVNNSSQSFVLNPNGFSAQYSRDNGNTWYDAKLWTHNEYMKRVANRQAWAAAAMAMSEQIDVDDAGKTTTSSTSSYAGTSTTNSSVDGNYDSYSNYGSYSANGYASTRASVYGTSKTTTEDGYAKYAAQKEADANVAAYGANLDSQKQVLSQGYLKLNTIQPNVQIDGFIQFNFDKRATNMSFTISVGNDSFLFAW